ncbi:hypothetical protein OPQ81_007236 [Rhizoctonia solani]|nr:hypothetical protein OPQ81_007236 [Rhizoctonia solani]
MEEEEEEEGNDMRRWAWLSRATWTPLSAGGYKSYSVLERFKRDRTMCVLRNDWIEGFHQMRGSPCPDPRGRFRSVVK